MGTHRRARPVSFWVSFGLIAIGALLLGYSAWTMIIADELSSAGKKDLALSYSTSEPSKPAVRSFVDIESAKEADVIGRMVVPRLGEDFVRLIGEGTRWHPVLNEIGIGHYTSTAMPGEVGNFATAAHRGGFGGTYKNVHRITSGDKAYVQTNDGWYTYRYLETKIVKPNQTEVIAAVPGGLSSARSGGRYMTMTSCDPIFVNTDRIIVWFEFEAFSPVGEKPPAAVSWLETK